MTDKKTVLITGASGGIGSVMAKLFAREGFHVFVSARSVEKAQPVVEEILNSGGSAEPLPMDVGDIASIEAAAKNVNERNIALDALINNAGVNVGQADNILDASREDIDVSLKVNGLGPLETTKAFLPALKAAPHARIVNVSTETGSIAETIDENSAFAFLEGGSYRLSKTMTNAVTGLLTKALRGTEIKVNAMCPGWTATDMGGPDAPNSPDVGAALAFNLATLDASGPTGTFVNSDGPLKW
ncbi:MAG: SDR family NAD(P)-dependent oxidoreductase [Pseudomonadota bacterium]